MVLAAGILLITVFSRQHGSAFSEWSRRESLTPLKEIRFELMPTKAVGSVEPDDFETMLQLELRRASITFKTDAEMGALATEINSSSTDNQTAEKDRAIWDKFFAAPSLSLSVSLDPIPDTNRSSLVVSFELQDMVPNPRKKGSFLQATLWHQESQWFVAEGKVDDRVRAEVTKFAQEFCNDWLAAHDPAFPKFAPGLPPPPGSLKKQE